MASTYMVSKALEASRRRMIARVTEAYRRKSSKMADRDRGNASRRAVHHAQFEPAAA
jgi:hypothetical protein